MQKRAVKGNVPGYFQKPSNNITSYPEMKPWHLAQRLLYAALWLLFTGLLVPLFVRLWGVNTQRGFKEMNNALKVQAEKTQVR